MSAFPAPGDAIGRFRIVGTLGSGGMGVVYDAVEDILERRVALKVISPQFAQDPEFRQRFTSEARALASLDSAHCTTVYAHGEEDGHLYIATQLIPDGDLARMLQRWGPAPVGKAVELMEQIASGLTDAHAAGLVHRDIKPANIFVRRRGAEVHAYLGDFGIARRVDAEVTRVGSAVIGTPSYMAPELHRGGSAGVATDVYSVGCLLWVVLTASPPYPGSSEYEIVSGHVSKPVPQLADTTGGSELVAWANHVLARTMAKDPAQRYATAQELRDDLRTAGRLTGDPAYLQPGVPTGTSETRVPGAGVASPPSHPPLAAPSNPPAAVPAYRPPSNPPSGPSSNPPAGTPYPGPSWGPPASAPRRRRTGLWVAAGVAAVVLVGGGTAAALALAGSDGSGSGGSGGSAGSAGSGGSGGSSEAPTEEEQFLALDPSEIAAEAEKDMRVLDSVRLAGAFDGSGTTGGTGGGQSELTVTSAGDCAGTFALDGGTAELRSLGGTAWLRPDAAFFGAATGDPEIGAVVADRLGDRWLLADATQADQFASFCDLDELLESSGDTSEDGTTVEGTRDVRGTPTVEVHSTDDVGSESTAFVSVTAPHYVLRIEDPSLGRIDFSDFDEPFAVTAPPADQVVTVEQLGAGG